MIISNLMHCQTVAASDEVLGGRKTSIIKNKVYQNVDAYALAVNLGDFGEATAYNKTNQSVSISNSVYF